LSDLEREMAELEERRRREEEERRRLAELAKVPDNPKRKWYIPVKGDIIDETMAKYLNACPHYVPVKRLGEG